MGRPMILSMSGWYPSTKQSCIKEIESFINEQNIDIKNCISTIVPHAGWYFCGKLSINCIRILREKSTDIKNVFIFGGHLSTHSKPILETFDYAETPLGELINNKEVLKFLSSNKEIEKLEFVPDNTIEVLLPIVKYFFKDTQITAIYLPPNNNTIKFVEDLYDNFGKNSVFIGSTDLTHYGPNYDFYHSDKNIPPIDWVRNVNDKNYVDLLLNVEDKKGLEYALKNKSACSSGAALGAVTVARKNNITKGNLLSYSTSYDLHKDKSFVGYAGIIY
ncbi:MAG: AmmeMemoRadiSam system protein B [Spirochaetes bacterium GWD1_27_9]|nr:MAG: AmmeMemoRadiSam system protein B [Spirochaetes bacterium GWB1_27_13]OHD25871.1 MAG: AmmeMemoRadiSam system protein B [Spirochaetes bacterium GWC1_27_15]OHD34415.1 MAG: AmmeMemoRadiSam system protein B [Spirochaetes bacterium GWD1_27_9]